MSSLFPNSSRWTWAIIIALILPRLVTLCVPILAIDEAIYGVFAREILHGAIPYRDLVDYKGPVIFYFYALAFALGGDGNMAMVHFLHLLVVAALCWILSKIGKLVGNPEVGRLTALFYAVFSAAWTTHQALATNGEVLMVLPLGAAAWLLLRGDNKSSILNDWLGGCLLGVAFLTKYTAGINLFLTLAYLGFFQILPFMKEPRKLGGGLLRCTTWLLGFVVPLVACGLYFYAKGSWQDFYFWGWLYNQSYIHQGESLNTWDYFLLKIVVRTAIFASGSLLIWILGGRVIAQTVQSWRKRFPFADSLKSQQTLFVTFWFLLSFIPVSMGGRLFFHYYNQITPPLCILGAVGAAAFVRKKAGRLAILVGCMIPLAIFMTESTHRALHPDQRNQEIVAYLEKHSDLADRIFVWGYLPHAYLLSHRRPATRFVFVQFLTGSSPKTNGMDFDPNDPTGRPGALARVLMDLDPKIPPVRHYDTSEFVVPQAWDMLFADFARTPPLYILDTSPANIQRYGNYPIEQYRRLAALLASDYERETTIGEVVMYRRKGPAHSSSEAAP